MGKLGIRYSVALAVLAVGHQLPGCLSLLEMGVPPMVMVLPLVAAAEGQALTQAEAMVPPVERGYGHGKFCNHSR
jgi:hypothetical protein